MAVEKWMEANEIDAVAIQCWDSLEQNYGCAACVTMSMLSEKLIPAACEVDIAGAVSMYALIICACIIWYQRAKHKELQESNN